MVTALATFAALGHLALVGLLLYFATVSRFPVLCLLGAGFYSYGLARDVRFFIESRRDRRRSPGPT